MQEITESVQVMRGSRGFSIARVTRDSWSETGDALAIEEPLEIRLLQADDGYQQEFSLSVTMRTPGNDAELAVGFLLSEGLIRSIADVRRIRPCVKESVVRIHLAPHVRVDPERLRRHFYTTSSCGVCGKASIDAVRQVMECELLPLPESISVQTIHSLPARQRESQQVFDQTGGLHASSLFTLDGEAILTREDVGRHNALDKLIGAQFYADESVLCESVLMVSGRVSFELVQKALMAGIPILAAVGAPSSLAIELAAQHSMTLVGFLRNDRFNVYCGQQRVRR